VFELLQGPQRGFHEAVLFLVAFDQTDQTDQTDQIARIAECLAQ